MATSEPVVLHHGREEDGDGHHEVRPSAPKACWAASSPVRSREQWELWVGPKILEHGEPVVRTHTVRFDERLERFSLVISNGV